MFLNKVGLLQSQIVRSAVKRCLNLSPTLAQQQQSVKVKDPIQQLFLDKIREYDSKLKSKTDKDSLVDASPDQEKAYKDELNRIDHMYGVKGPEELKSFPTLQFQDPSCQNVEMPSIAMEIPEDKSENRSGWVPDMPTPLID